MNRKGTIAILQFSAAFLCLAILLFATGLAPRTSGLARGIVLEIAAVCLDYAYQWMLIVCLLMYLGIFIFLEFREKNELQAQAVHSQPCHAPASFSAWSRHVGAILLIGLLILCLVGYVINYPSSARSLQILTLLVGIVVGKAFAVWVNSPSFGDDMARSHAIHPLVAVLTMIVSLLSVAVFYQPDSGPAYAYHDIRRWTGPWDNPNLFGLLLGTGAVLAAGVGLGGWEMANTNWMRKIRKHFFMLLCLIAVILSGHGLYHSLSRGAWLGTAVGLVFLIAKSEIGNRKSEIFGGSCVSWLKQNRLPLFAIILSVFVVGFWQLRFSNFQPAQRIASVANPNDFSWRNRLSAWQGAARMMVDKPLTGFGWGQAEAVYAKRYCTTASNDSGAIKMNDYLMLGISGGVPVMLCFIGYVALAFRRPHLPLALSPPAGSGEGKVESLVSRHLLLQTTCRAGAIVLLVGFWFDGGLFKLPTAVVFWTLLELSRLEFLAPKTALTSASVEQSSLPTNYGKPNRWLSRAAWCAVMVAVGVTSFYLFASYLPVSDKTIAIARHYLILSKERADFDFLANKPFWHGQKLRTLLDQTELANYNRELINWNLDEKIYRNYVLSPIIEPSSTSNAPSLNLNWRRSLWEAFYPRIRHENSPADAAQIVVRYLRERVAIADLPNPPHSVSAIWSRQITDEKGFQIIYVAALRSVGVPARLDANGQAEFYDGQEWQIARTPCVVSGSPVRNK